MTRPSLNGATVQSAPIRWNEEHPRVWYMFCPRCRTVGQSWHSFENARSDATWHQCDVEALAGTP
jgi:hypothetical protein